MSVSQYEIFVKAAETGSLTLAARALGCTQSNVSHAIAALEKSFGFPLLVRGRRGARLTSEGERLLPYVRAICQREEQLLSVARELAGLQGGRLRIGSFTSVAVHWLPQLLKSFRQEYPNVDFELLSGDYHDLDGWITDGSVDVAFVRLPTDLPWNVLPLYEDRLMALLPADHPKAALPAFPVEQVEGEAFISLPESSDHDSTRMLREAGLEPDVRFTTKDDYALIAMVESGLGISIVPELLMKGRTGRFRLLPLEPAWTRTIALALPSQCSPAAERFAAFVMDWAKAAAQQETR